MRLITLNMLHIMVFGCLLGLVSCGDKGGNGGGEAELDPKISIQNITKFEGDDNQTFNFKVSLEKISDKIIEVDFDTEEETAGFDIDFIQNSGTLVFQPGEQQANIEVEGIGDIYKEQDETFLVVLSNPKNCILSTSEGAGTIRNDDDFVEVPEDGYITPESYTGYDLVWGDEFNGTSIDTECWGYNIGNNGWGNNELQYYTDSEKNAYLEDGKLVIEAIKESFEGAPYTSARMLTQGKKSFLFGRVDIRAILPQGQGIWPALWMLGDNISDIGWPACGEMDIMELIGHEPSSTHGTAHWGPQGQTFSYNKGAAYNLSSGKFADEFHVFTIDWEPGKISWYVDDNLFFTLDNDDVNGSYPFDNTFFFIFNIAVGGNWPGYPDETTVFPQKMYVDYIRVFQKS